MPVTQSVFEATNVSGYLPTANQALEIKRFYSFAVVISQVTALLLKVTISNLIT